MNKDEWKRNDALIKAALEKMGLNFKRNKRTWEAYAYIGRAISKNEVACYNGDDYLVVEGPNTSESLGEIKCFYGYINGRHIRIDNIFFGVTSDIELKVKLDLMT